MSSAINQSSSVVGDGSYHQILSVDCAGTIGFALTITNTGPNPLTGLKVTEKSALGAGDVDVIVSSTDWTTLVGPLNELQADPTTLGNGASVYMSFLTISQKFVDLWAKCSSPTVLTMLGATK